MIIGGEYTFDPEVLQRPVVQTLEGLAGEHHPDYHRYLTGGGYYSLKVILSELKTLGRAHHPILLPSYLCPSILRPFRELGIPYAFYPVDGSLAPDVTSLHTLISHPEAQAVMVIPYFGFSLPEGAKNAFLHWQKAGVLLIEDRAQCLFPGFAPIGDYVFYSFRKFLPVDGSLLLSKQEVVITFDHWNEAYVDMKKEAQQLRHRFLTKGADTEAAFIPLLEEAETLYYQEGIAGFDEQNLELFSRLDIDGEVHQRRRIFSLLHGKLHEIALISDPMTSTASPLCFPVLVEQREQIRQQLGRRGIFAPVHWKITEQDVPASFTASHALSASLLSLPIRTGIPEEAYLSMADTFLEMIRR